MRLLSFLLLVPAFAGCLSQDEYRLHGAFTADRTQADLDDFQATVAPYVDGPVALMESYPEQFSIGGLSKADCDGLRQALATKDYLGSLGECRPVEPVDDPDRPTSGP